MAVAATLDFRNFQILLAEGVWRAKMHHHAKFRRNQSTVAEILRLFDFSGHPPSWICLGHIYTTHGGYLVQSIQKFRKSEFEFFAR